MLDRVAVLNLKPAQQTATSHAIRLNNVPSSKVVPRWMTAVIVPLGLTFPD